MKYLFNLCGCAAVLLLVGCATQSQVATMEGQGRKQVFNASYDQVWRAAIDAAQIGDLEVKTADKANGYIGARRGMRLATHGENVGIWVRSPSPGQTQVEIVSKQAGPPKFWIKNWEDEIMGALTANLTREVGTPTIKEPAGVETQSDPKVSPVAPPPPPVPPTL